MAQKSYRDIIADIKKGTPAPVYILMGEEAYYIDLIVRHLEQDLIAEEDRDFNFNLFYGNDADMEAVIACAQQFPVMSDRKLVLLKEGQSAQQAKNVLEKLAPYVANCNPTTVFALVFKGDNLNATSKLMKAASANKGAVVFKSAAVKDWQLPSDVKDYCSGAKVSIEEKAVQLLCEYIGSPLSKLFGELNKLILIKGGQKGIRITCEDIERNIGISKDFNNFELSKAISQRNYPQAIKIIKYFKKNPKQNPYVMAASAIFNLFSRVVICQYTADKSDQGLMSACGLKNSYALREIRDAMRNYNPRQAVNAVHYIREYDAKSKGVGSLQDPFDLLGEAVFKIMT